MSTPEFFALQGLVATIVSAFENGLAIVQMIKQQRQESGAAPPSENLEDSLTIGSSTVESKMEEVKRLYMSARTVGDGTIPVICHHWVKAYITARRYRR